MNALTPDLKPFINAETVTLANYLTDRFAEQSVNNSTISQQNFINWLNDYIQENTKPIIELSNTRPSYESLKQQFHALLSQRDSWKDVIQAGGGQTILDFITVIGTLGQAGIVTASQETNLDGAVLTSSIYTLMRMLGVHIRRKIPSRTELVKMSNTTGDNIYIPQYSQFNINGVGFFNREPIVIDSNLTEKFVTLYQGVITIESYTSNGSPYQRFELGSNDYNISDTDVLCYLPDGKQWVRTEQGLWKYGPKDQVFFENTTPNGNVEITFGNGIYGGIVPQGQTMQFVYVRTNGNLADTSDVGRFVEIVALNSWVPDRIKRITEQETNAYIQKVINLVKGQTTTAITGGDVEKDKEHYRAVGPFINSGRKGMIRRADHYGVALEYPGIADILFQGQRELDRYDRNLINVVHVTPLLKSGRAMTDSEWRNFVIYLKERGIWRLDWVHVPPVGIPVDVKAKIWCFRDSNPQSVDSYAEYNIRQNFAIRRGSLNFDITVDDIYDSLNLNYNGLRVDYIDLDTPLQNTPVGKTEFAYIRNLTLDVDYTPRGYNSFIPPRTITPT